MVSFNTIDEKNKSCESIEATQGLPERDDESTDNKNESFVLYKIVDNQPIYVDGDRFDLSRFIESIKKTIAGIDWKKHPSGAEQNFKIKLQKAFGLSTQDTTPAPNPNLVDDLDELEDVGEKEVLSIANETVGDDLLFDF